MENNNTENQESNVNLLAQVEFLLLDNIETGTGEYKEMKDYIEISYRGPKNTPCGSCKNANWFVSEEIVNQKMETSAKFVKCYCNKLFRETIDMKLTGLLHPKKFIHTCGGNPTFIKK